ncbi:MAG: hypothetical protein RLZZ546_2940 [Bacteroidota bacterium]|jgi:Icc-related predicted phosphoesterase
MKIVAISDTHLKHRKLHLPQADMIIHAGDVSSRGKESEIIDFLSWYEDLKNYKYKIFIAGNHDFYFENNIKEEIEKIIPPSVIYLNDSSVCIEGINIWGSPISPWFYDWAFNRQRGPEIKKHWDLIPQDTDMLITHGPVFGKLDRTVGGSHVGCEDLLNTILSIKPKIHICGHIHEGYGVNEGKFTTFINASVLDINYEIKNRPIVFEINELKDIVNFE